VRRLERAQLAEERHTKNKSWETASVNDNIDHDPEKRYHISKSHKDTVNLYAYIYDNEGDPAFKVGLRIPRIYWSKYLSQISIGFHAETQRPLTRTAS